MISIGASTIPGAGGTVGVTRGCHLMLTPGAAAPGDDRRGALRNGSDSGDFLRQRTARGRFPGGLRRPGRFRGAERPGAGRYGTRHALTDQGLTPNPAKIPCRDGGSCGRPGIRACAGSDPFAGSPGVARWFGGARVSSARRRPVEGARSLRVSARYVRWEDGPSSALRGRARRGLAGRCRPGVILGEAVGDGGPDPAEGPGRNDAGDCRFRSSSSQHLGPPADVGGSGRISSGGTPWARERRGRAKPAGRAPR
jgi:hypothetical protein